MRWVEVVAEAKAEVEAVAEVKAEAEGVAEVEVVAEVKAEVAGRAVWAVQKLAGRAAIVCAQTVGSGRRTWLADLVIRGSAPSAAQR